MTKGSKFDDFLKDENIEIDEEKIKENIEQMTDKIIIDGVNVAGCKYLNKVVNEEPYCNIDEEHLYTCSSDENCYYKQLKRLEQENATYKANAEAVQKYITQNEQLKTHIDGLEKKNAELKAENEQLKEKIIKLSEEKGHLIVKNNTLEESNQSLSMLGTDLASANETVRKEFFRADKNKDMWREKAENLQQTLRKIKAIAEHEIKELTDSAINGGRYLEIIDLITKAESEG